MGDDFSGTCVSARGGEGLREISPEVALSTLEECYARGRSEPNSGFLFILGIMCRSNSIDDQ